MKHYLGLEPKKVDRVGEALNVLLASYHVHYQNLRDFHWNLRSKEFFTLHVKFEEFYTDANEKIDAIAERILTLDRQPLSHFSDYLRVSTIKECETAPSDVEMVQAVLTDYTELIRLEREVLRAAEEAEDQGTNDMIGTFLGEIEKRCWMLSAWLKRFQPQEAEPVKKGAKQK